MYSIGLRYCGGCNPQIDRARAVGNLQEKLKKTDMAVAFITDREKKVDLVLLVNGCTHACLEEAYRKEGNNTRFISIKGEMVDSEYVREDQIPEIVIRKLVGLIDSSSH